MGMVTVNTMTKEAADSRSIGQNQDNLNTILLIVSIIQNSLILSMTTLITITTQSRISCVSPEALWENLLISFTSTIWINSEAQFNLCGNNP
jgi:hypothetical protein